jgi:hypothetical protein
MNRGYAKNAIFELFFKWLINFLELVKHGKKSKCKNKLYFALLCSEDY